MADQITGTRSKLRSLVSNHFLPDFDYLNYKLAFQTVFYKTEYSHCCCPCTFHHEFIGYLSDTGGIDEDMFENVLNNIERGQCEHVDKVNEKYVRETSIYAIHIAAAVGTMDAVKQLLDSYSNTLRGSCFRLSPKRAAILKCQYDVINAFTRALPRLCRGDPMASCGSRVMYPCTSRPCNNTMTIEWITSLEYSLRKRDRHLLECVLCPYVLHTDLNKAFECMFRQDFQEDSFQSYLLVYLETFMSNTCVQESCLWLGCVATAILYNKPETLRSLLNICRSRTKESNLFLYFTSDILGFSDGLKRSQCSDILIEYGLRQHQCEFSGKECPVTDYLIKTWFDYEDSNATIDNLATTFPCLKNTNWMILAESTGIHGFKKILDYGLLETIDNGKCFKQILHGSYVCNNSYNYRGLLELFLFENPQLDESAETIIRIYGFKLRHHYEFGYMSLAGEYILNLEENSIFGTASSKYFALNFIGPLLVEVGLPVRRTTLQKGLERQLHPAEREYIRSYLSGPRSLMSLCRGVLRQLYKRRQIHDFVKQSAIPTMIKDYILLKDILPVASKYI